MIRFSATVYFDDFLRSVFSPEAADERVTEEERSVKRRSKKSVKIPSLFSSYDFV
jgi:hypothetical protein